MQTACLRVVHHRPPPPALDVGGELSDLLTNDCWSDSGTWLERERSPLPPTLFSTLLAGRQGGKPVGTLPAPWPPCQACGCPASPVAALPAAGGCSSPGVGLLEASLLFTLSIGSRERGQTKATGSRRASGLFHICSYVSSKRSCVPVLLAKQRTTVHWAAGQDCDAQPPSLSWGPCYFPWASREGLLIFGCKWQKPDLN